MKRLWTAAIGVPAVTILTLYAPNWLFALVAAAFAGLMLDEFTNLYAARGRPRPGRWFAAAGGAVTAAFAANSSIIIGTLTLVSMVLLGASAFRKSVENALDVVTCGLAGLIYCCILLGFIVAIPRSSVLVLLTIIWVGDSCAYFGGRAFGKRPLAPVVSPKKTVEGGIAGLVGSVVAGTLLGAWLLNEQWGRMAGIALVTGLVGQIGDLAESALKRSAGVKDSSSILPGHGGILDRLDSLLFAAPLFYWIFS